MAATKTTERAAKSATEAFEQATTGASQAVRENFDRGLAAMSEAQAFGKQNMDAFLASATAAQKGMEAISSRSAAFSKNAIENHVAAAKSLMTSKSVQEFVEKQNEYAKSSFEAYVAELTGFSELFSGVAKDVTAPINERITAAGQVAGQFAQVAR